MTNAYTFDEDLYALPVLLPTLNAQKQLARYLQLIQRSASHAELAQWLEQVNGYMQALNDLELLNNEQATLLCELVMRAHFRCVLT